MSRDDDRGRKGRRDEGRWAAVEGGFGTWAQGGGLLDGLPEAGRGAGPLKKPAPAGPADTGGTASGQRPAAAAPKARPNPFSAPPAAPARPAAPAKGASAAPPAPKEPAAPAATAEPVPAAPAEPARRPNVIPFRSAATERFAAQPAPASEPEVESVPEAAAEPTAPATPAAEPAPAPAPAPTRAPTTGRSATVGDVLGGTGISAATVSGRPHPSEPAAPPAADAGAGQAAARRPEPAGTPGYPAAAPQAPAAAHPAPAPSDSEAPARPEPAVPPAPPAPAAPTAPAVQQPAAASAAPEPPAEPAIPDAPPLPVPTAPADLGAAAEHSYPESDRAAVYRAISERRDVRDGFRPDPVPDEVLTRMLQAAHQAPSVGFSQPWDFVVIHDLDVRGRVNRLVREQRDSYSRALPGARARAFSGLKAEAVLDAPVNIVVTVDPTRGGRHALGHDAQPQSAGHSAALAVQNLWLAARAEGLGVGWVSFYGERDLARELDLPPHLEIVAYLCVGYVEDFPTEPELALGGWAQRRPLSWAVHRDHYGRRGLPGAEPTSLLDETIAAIAPLNPRAMDDARGRQALLTDDPSALGAIGEVQVRLAGLGGESAPPVPEPAAVAVFAADHGAHAQGVVQWPQETTTRMVRNLLSGGAIANAFADQVGAEVTVVDVGLVGDLPPVAGLLSRKIGRGTADCTEGPAMSLTQVGYAVEAGIEVARDLVSAGNRCLVAGDMGVANTIATSALIAAFTGADPADVTGSGNCTDQAAREHAVDLVRRSLEANGIVAGAAGKGPLAALAALGGLEHAALAGFVLGAAALRVPVLLDGASASAAALAAVALAPDAAGSCVAGYRSGEPGHAESLAHMGLRPMMDMELRFGQGSGALLALPMLQGAARALREARPVDG